MVVTSNRNVNYVGPLDKSTTVMFLPFFHIFGLYTLLSGILFGMKIVLIKRFKPDIFLRAIEKHKANILYLVPSILLFLAKSDLLDTYDISCVKDILCGAAPVTADLQRAAEIRQVIGTIKMTAFFYLLLKYSSVVFYQNQIIII